MKLIFAGTPDFAVPSLRALAQAKFEIAAVLTQPDKPQGRKGILTPSPVKEAALALGIPVLQPARLRDDLAALKAVGADAMVTCAYGQILTQETLDSFPKGVWNVHASLLPRYRGAAPIARCIMDGARETGVTIMKTDVGLDTGDIFLKQACEIAADDTCGTLTKKLAEIGAELIVRAMKRVAAGDISLVKQGDGTVCKKVQRTEVDFSRSAEEVSRLIRALSPSPLSFARVGGLTLNFYAAQAVSCEEGGAAGEVLSLSPKEGLVVKCGAGAVRITMLQPAGGRLMRDTDFMNGRKVQKGQIFEQPVL